MRRGHHRAWKGGSTGTGEAGTAKRRTAKIPVVVLPAVPGEVQIRRRPDPEPTPQDTRAALFIFARMVSEALEVLPQHRTQARRVLEEVDALLSRADVYGAGVGALLPDLRRASDRAEAEALDMQRTGGPGPAVDAAWSAAHLGRLAVGWASAEPAVVRTETASLRRSLLDHYRGVA